MISVVIPNFNGARLLERNLPKLLELLRKTKLEYEVIIVDDASTDDSLGVLRSLATSHLSLVTSSKNRGFASTVDVGIRAASGEIVFTLKTDALPESADYFRLMLEHFDLKKNRSLEKNDSSKKEIFSVSAALHTVENGKPEVRGQGVITFSRGFFLHFRTHDDYEKWKLTSRSGRLLHGFIAKLLGTHLDNNVTIKQFNNGVSAWADGGASAFRKDFYLKIGGFDQLYNPFYWEDTDLGYRAWKAGYQIEFEPRAILVHDFESGAIAKHYTKEQVKIISQRNQFVFVWKNGDLKHLGLYLVWGIYHSLVATKNGDGSFFRAYWQAMLLWPRIFLARWRQKKVTKLMDDEALNLFNRI